MPRIGIAHKATVMMAHMVNSTVPRPPRFPSGNLIFSHRNAPEKVPPIALKAIVTTQNQAWNSLQLYRELKEEHEKMKSYRK